MQSELIKVDGDNGSQSEHGSSAVLQVIQRAASDPTCDVDKLERLLAMKERMDAKNAQTEFNAAMAAMQCDIPSIAERGEGHNRKSYATLEDINDVIKPIMQRYGFAISFRVEHLASGINVTGVLMHKAGHREETSLLLPADTSGNKNAVQAVASSVSYGKRYVMCAMLNISTRGEDDDGYAAAPQATITAAQAKQLSALLAKCSEKAKAAFESMYGSTELVSKADFDQVLAGLTKSAAKQQEAASADRS